MTAGHMILDHLWSLPYTLPKKNLPERRGPNDAPKIRTGADSGLVRDICRLESGSRRILPDSSRNRNGFPFVLFAQPPDQPDGPAIPRERSFLRSFGRGRSGFFFTRLLPPFQDARMAFPRVPSPAFRSFLRDRPSRLSPQGIFHAPDGPVVRRTFPRNSGSYGVRRQLRPAPPSKTPLHLTLLSNRRSDRKRALSANASVPSRSSKFPCSLVTSIHKDHHARDRTHLSKSQQTRHFPDNGHPDAPRSS